jgi:hypothetical protein
MSRLHLLPVAALSLLLSASPALAKPGAAAPSSPGLTSLSFWGVFDPSPDGAGLGMRLALPVVPEGILHARVKDELVLEFGADYLHYSQHLGNPYFVDYTWDGILFVGGLAWNFWVTPQLALYPKIDLGWSWGTYHGWDPVYGTVYSQSDFDGIFFQLAGGLIYRLKSVDLRVELGSGLVRLGVGIPL